MHGDLIARKCSIRLCGLACVLLSLLQAASAQFVEVIVQIEGTSKQSSRTYDSRCIFGTNTWLMEVTLQRMQEKRCGAPGLTLFGTV